MKILVFSDSHLTDHFEEKKYIFLKKLISSVDQVIINGDFWDGYVNTFDQFIKSRWQKLFPLLKSKKAIYIFGNHDQKRFSDKRTSLFSDTQLDRYRLKTKKYTFIIEHGNKIYPFYDESTDIKIPKVTELLLNLLVKILIKTTGKFFFNFPFGMRLNKTVKQRFQAKYTNNEILICGHTHSPEFNLKDRFINLGFTIYGLSHYLIIDKDHLEFKEEWYA